MKLHVYSVRLVAVIILQAVILAQPSFGWRPSLSVRDSGGAYAWTQAAAKDTGCWPDCAPGQWCWSAACERRGGWPLGVVPVVAFGRLWMISNGGAWVSDDGVRWEQARTNAGWGERYGMPAVFFRGRIWKLGGMEKTWDNFKNDVWHTGDGKDWKLAARHAGWSPRRGHSALVFDGRLWVLGGGESSGRRDQLPTRMLSDVWHTSDGVNWIKATERAPWSGNVNAVVFRDELWVIGGGGAWHSRDGREWTEAVSGAAWLERGGNGAAGCLVFDGKIWAFGGLGREGTLNDVWFSGDGVRWQQATAHAPWTRRGAEHSVVFKNKLWIYGGKTGRADVDNGYSSDVWHMSPTARSARHSVAVHPQSLKVTSAPHTSMTETSPDPLDSGHAKKTSPRKLAIPV